MAIGVRAWAEIRGTMINCDNRAQLLQACPVCPEPSLAPSWQAIGNDSLRPLAVNGHSSAKLLVGVMPERFNQHLRKYDLSRDRSRRCGLELAEVGCKLEEKRNGLVVLGAGGVINYQNFAVLYSVGINSVNDFP